jgi:ketosteroid isomerase-like protein
MSQLRLLAVALFVMSIGVLTFAQESTTGVGDKAGIEQQIKQHEQQLRDHVLKGDTSMAEQYLADDYVNINAAGQMLDKNQTVQAVRTGVVKYSSIDVTDERVRVYGDTAIDNVTSNTKLTVDGQDRSGQYRTTIVWVKQNGQWKRVSFQSTRVLSDMK